jgi:hypothetical protein
MMIWSADSWTGCFITIHRTPSLQGGVVPVEVEPQQLVAAAALGVGHRNAE